MTERTTDATSQIDTRYAKLDEVFRYLRIVLKVVSRTDGWWNGVGRRPEKQHSPVTALNSITPPGGTISSSVNIAMRVIASQVPDDINPFLAPSERISKYNDAPGRTQEEIIELLLRALEKKVMES